MFNMQTEQWIPIYGFEEFYEISNLGNIKSIANGNWRRKNGILVGTLDSMGYPHVILHGNGRIFTTTVHRLVAKAFIENPDNLPQINHKNAIKHDNRVENLEWCTCKQNQRHARAKQLQHVPKGSQTWNSKLTEEIVIEARRRYAAGGITYKDLAVEYGVANSVIAAAIKRIKWKHVI